MHPCSNLQPTDCLLIRGTAIGGRSKPQEFRSVPDFGIGLTDVAKHAFGSDADLPRDAFDAAALARKLAKYQPRIIAFTSKHAANAGLGLRSQAIAYGAQATRLAGCRVFILPSPSGQARGFWDIAPWQTLADAVRAAAYARSQRSGVCRGR